MGGGGTKLNEAKRQKLKKANRCKQMTHIACILTYLAQTDQNPLPMVRWSD